MSEVMTYNSLCSDIGHYAERSDQEFVSQIPRLIMLTENRLASEVHGLGTQRYVTNSLAQATIPKPERWRETVSLNITVAGSRKFLLPRSYNYCRVYSPDESATGVPEYFADYGYEHLIVVPTPQTAFPMELCYYERPLPLSDSNQTSWYTQYAPQLLLYGTLLEAQPFLKRPERIGEFQSLFDRAVSAVSGESERRLQNNASAIQRTGEQ